MYSKPYIVRINLQADIDLQGWYGSVLQPWRDFSGVFPSGFTGACGLDRALPPPSPFLVFFSIFLKISFINYR